MSYTEHTWVTGETITADKLNNMESGIVSASQSVGLTVDAIIHLEHADNSGADNSSNLTVSIVSGTFSELSAKIGSGGYPYILVEYHHPWGTQFISPMAFIHYPGVSGISIAIAGFSPFGGSAFKLFGYCIWNDDDTIVWDD